MLPNIALTELKSPSVKAELARVYCSVMPRSIVKFSYDAKKNPLGCNIVLSNLNISTSGPYGVRHRPVPNSHVRIHNDCTL